MLTQPSGSVRRRPAKWWLEQGHTLRISQVVSPSLQAALLTVVAAVDGLTVTERSTVTVSVDDRRAHPAQRIVLVFDAATGLLRESEHILLTRCQLPVRPPATLDRTEWLATGFTPNTDSRR